ncbi:hypothetical protein BSKO_01859 [Bryopsis sp. KO-2023]|nr:hypothetical protein BSKO_01859 [Bryopsis sp. KO-2023]
MLGRVAAHTLVDPVSRWAGIRLIACGLSVGGFGQFVDCSGSPRYQQLAPRDHHCIFYTQRSFLGEFGVGGAAEGSWSLFDDFGAHSLTPRRCFYRHGAKMRKLSRKKGRQIPIRYQLPPGKTPAQAADEDKEEYFRPETPYKSTSSEVLSASFADFPPLEEQKALQVGLLGVPNAGKSELTNRLVGNKVTAVSSKENTTVTPNLGSFVVGNTQIILYDLPGVLHPDDCKFVGQLSRIKGAWATASDCDYMLFVVDAQSHLRYLNEDGKDRRLERIFTKLNIGLDVNGQAQAYPPVILLLNKVDLVDDREKLVELAKVFYGKYPFKKCFFISALKGGGIQYLKEYLVRKGVSREWVFPPGVITDKTPICLALELTREKLFRRLNKELPYEINTVHEEWREMPDGTALIKQTMYVHNDRIRRMVVGKKGEIIQSYIAFRAQRDLIKILGRKVLLSIKVKVVNPLGKLAAQGK